MYSSCDTTESFRFSRNLCLSLDAPQAPSTMAQTDRDALVALYRATGGENWRESQNWDTDADLKTWHGVDVNEQGRVVKLKLRDNNLEGTLWPILQEERVALAKCFMFRRNS